MITLYTSGGIGDQLQGFVVAKLLQDRGQEVAVNCCARNEVYRVLDYLFHGKLPIAQLPEDTGDKLANDDSFFQEMTKGEEAYLVWPDLLFRHPRSVGLLTKQFLRLNSVKSLRLFADDFSFCDKRIYVGLVTSTEGYLYPKIPELLDELSATFPDYEIYFPLVKQWADKKLNLGHFDRSFDGNVNIDTEPHIVLSIERMMDSAYCICTDNGPSHIAYHTGMNRLLLDPRFGYNNQTIPWAARWRETLDDSVPLELDPKTITQIVKTNLQCPQTRLIPQRVVAMNLGKDWSKELLFKW